jgi:hypothetical protein
VILWLAAGAALVALVVAGAAWRQSRAAVRRQEQLTQMYWELKFQHGELRVQLRQSNAAEALRQTGLTGESPQTVRPQSDTPPGAPGQPADAFVPLTSLKR